MQTTVSVAEVRERFSEILNRIVLCGDRYVISRHGKVVATLGPPEETAPIQKSECAVNATNGVAIDA